MGEETGGGMGERNSAAPVIIKRKKVVAGHGHHGGAWKVAFADFATAMMAFFLMMWLLGATSESQRKGLADYFNPSIPIHRISSGGEGLFGGESIQSPSQSGNDIATEEMQEAGEGSAEAEALEDVATRIAAMSGESAILQEALRHVLTRVTDEGLVIEIFDLPGAPLFQQDTAAPMPVLQVIADVMAQVIPMVTNPLAVVGHTRQHSVVQSGDPAWALSQSRAEMMRQLLLSRGTMSERVLRTAAHADRRLVHENPMSERNNRLEVILLRSRL